jgi:hypothetical protein
MEDESLLVVAGNGIGIEHVGTLRASARWSIPTGPGSRQGVRSIGHPLSPSRRAGQLTAAWEYDENPTAVPV